MSDALAHRVAVLNGGRIVTEGSAPDLKAQVGSERLTLYFADRDTLDRAQRLLGDQVATDAGAVSASLPLDVPDDLRVVLDTLEAANLDVAGVALAAPTLDDVFLTATSDRSNEVVR